MFLVSYFCFHLCTCLLFFFFFFGFCPLCSFVNTKIGSSKKEKNQSHIHTFDEFRITILTATSFSFDKNVIPILEEEKKY